MDIGQILKESIDIAKNNIILIVPTLAASVIIAILVLLLIGGSIASMALMGMDEMDDPGAMMTAVGGIIGIALILGMVSMVLGIISHGVVVAMAREAIDTGATSLGSGLSVTMGKIGHLIIASILVSLIVTIGSMFLLLPGLIAAFFFMFTFVGIIVSDLSAIEAMKKSFEIVKTNFRDAILIFLVIIGIGFLFSFGSSIFGIIPIIGQLIGMAAIGLFWAYISIVLVRSYQELTGAS